jgi:hypothetical protein
MKHTGMKHTYLGILCSILLVAELTDPVKADSGATASFSPLFSSASLSVAQSPSPIDRPRSDLAEETTVSFQTSRYAVRVYRQQGLWRMNVYNIQTDRVEARGLIVQVRPSDTGVTITNVQGDPLYFILVAPDGSQYRLTVRQRNQVTHNEQVANPNARNRTAQAEAPETGAQSLPQSDRPAAPETRSPLVTADQLMPEPETIFAFQTRKYAVRVYSQSNELRMNVYNRATDQVELQGGAIRSTRSGNQTIYSNLSGPLIYSVMVLPIGGYRLEVSQRERVIYSEPGY